jgi:hypothetical protein
MIFYVRYIDLFHILNHKAWNASYLSFKNLAVLTSVGPLNLLIIFLVWSWVLAGGTSLVSPPFPHICGNKSKLKRRKYTKYKYQKLKLFLKLFFSVLKTKAFHNLQLKLIVNKLSVSPLPSKNYWWYPKVW